MAISIVSHDRDRTMHSWTPALILLVALLLVIPSGAHAPRISTGDVVVVPDAEKSYAWYGLLGEPGETDRYLISAEAGTDLRISTSSPDPGTALPFALIGPGITTRDLPPADAGIPEGDGSIVVPLLDTRQPPAYEPFTPMALFEGASLSLPAPASGTYTIAVTGAEGRYLLATGFSEEFSPAEWVLIPVSILSVRLWQGQNLFANLLPILAAVLIGAWWFRRHHPAPPWPWAWLPVIAGFSFLGSGMLVVIQMVAAAQVTGLSPSMLLTVFFAAVPVILGLLLVRTAAGTGPSPSYRERAVMMILGLGGLIFWAGLIAGPVLAMAASLMPGAGTPGAS